MEIYLFRHCESEKNTTPDIISGRSNSSSLTKKGELQALKLRERIRKEGIAFDELYSSPAIRCLETARIAFPDYEPIIDDRLQEIDQGGWTDKGRSEMYTPEVILEMQQDPWRFKAPKGESQEDTAKRMIEFIKDKINLSKTDNHIGISGHGGAIRYAFSELFDMDRKVSWKIPLENASITQIRYQEGLWIPVKLNDFGHIYF